MTSRFIATRISACALASASLVSVAAAQSTAPASLPPIEVTTKATKPTARKAKAAQAAPTQAKPVVATQVPPPAQAAKALTGSPLQRSGALTSPGTAEARAEIQRTPGAVAVVPDTAYKASTPAATIKDALDFTPGVFAQTKWGEDTRLSIRGSGLSRNFHGRGVQLLMDGIIPVTTADGSSDFQEIDPTAYRYIEVFKGGNALRYGANQLGGAINFVMPTGYDADAFGTRVDLGSFGFHKTAVSSGGVYGAADYFITGSWQEQDGFRDHSEGQSVRGAMNVGYRLTPNIETRFYLNANQIRQKIPGAVTKQNALNDPKGAFVLPGLGNANAFPFSIGNDNVDRDYERNIDSIRVANRTAVRLNASTMLEAGAFYFDRHLDHPILFVIDNQTQDYGGFGRLTNESMIGGFRNLFTAGVTVHNGDTRARTFRNLRGERGGLLSDADQTSDNTVVYAENSFFVVPSVALVGGLQYVDASRVQHDRLANQDKDGQFDFWNPKGGVVWDVTAHAQIFANVSRSGEAPTFNETGVVQASTLKPQEATTYEIGTRGSSPNFRWDLALYRSNIVNEFQCLDAGQGACTQTNADKTIHQGVEVGAGAALWQGMFVESPRSPDKLWLNLAYTFSDFRFDGDASYGDNELAGAPRHYLRAELLYKHPSGIFAGPNVEWVPDAYYADNANTFETDAYAIWGAKIGYEGERITAYLEARNLTDETYISSASISGNLNGLDANVFEPGTGRAIYGGLSVKW
ncbi:MAG: TonB-dependent receptor [Hyphomicrobiaceae bacterium]|nr:TonB-dependent receptor [Hyphomicrobiaceae bacterium]